jgi:16S rRNA (adenine1518-N6/adenine1519-N6)-dimethyltransferase
MSLFQPTELFKFLESIGHKPSKRLSQNFLIDGNILNKILTSAHISPGDFVIEIGPGPGVLTEGLLKLGAQVIAIEKDPLFAKSLHRLQTPLNSLKVFQEDILEFPLVEVLKAHLQPHKRAKVISNLPYHLTSPIFDKILPLHPWIDRVIVMIQKEVADRIVSKHGSKNYSSFSIFTQFYSDVSLLFQVSPQCFYPKPKVTSAVIECLLKAPPSHIHPSLFLEFVRKAFSTRRKMLTTSLKTFIDQEKLIHCLNALSIDIKSRPEQLSLEEFLTLFTCLTTSS